MSLDPGDDVSVAYLLDFYPELSETFIRLEIEELRRQGTTVHVLALQRSGDGGPDASTVWWINEEAPVGRLRLAVAHAQILARHPRRYLRARRAKSRVASEATRFPWRRMPWLALELQRSGVRWLHAHFAWSGAAAAAVLSELTGLPWSVSLHAKDIFSDQRNLEYKLGAADHLVTVCEYNRAWLDEHFQIERPMTIVVCGVHVPGLQPQPEASDVVAVARFVEKKGLDVLVRAAALLAPARPGLRVDIVGDGPLLEQLAALIAQLGVEDIVRLQGPRPHEETLRTIAGARVFCFPARIASDGDRDSMPVVIKEAMARGVAVVAADVVGVPEMVDESTGWLVPPDDPTALAAAIREALANPDERRRRGVAAHARVRDRFQIEAEVAKLRAIFRGGADRVQFGPRW